MELLKSYIPVNLRASILSTCASDLTASCDALAQHFSASPHFSQLLEELTSPDLTTCAKDAVVAAKWKRDGNAAFDSQDYERALSYYTTALRYAPLPSFEESTVSQATLFVNRAASLHKLGLLEPALRDCGRAVDLRPSYSKAWYRRARVKSDLNDFHGAVRDMESALTCETTAGGRLQIKKELVLIQANQRSVAGSGDRKFWSTSPDSEEECTDISGTSSKVIELLKIQQVGSVRKHWTEGKGWGLQAREDLLEGTLVFQEDPFAALVLKSCRDTHCHFCFKFLPADPVPCSGCAIPFYCSDLCRTHATGSSVGHETQSIPINSKEAEQCLVSGVPFANSFREPFKRGTPEDKVVEDFKKSLQRFGEHVAECGGGSWSAVLPTEAVLGARMLFQQAYMENGMLKRNFPLVEGTEVLAEVDTLCNHYENLSQTDKLDLHVLGVVVAHCVRPSALALLETGTELAAISSKLIAFIAQVRVNAMAIYVMSSPDLMDDTANKHLHTKKEISHLGTNSVCTVEHVKVAQGIFLVGSRLNHSCVPNVHASFVLGRLSLRAITKIGRDSMLELCYGPQLGKLSQLERKRELLERYFFTCTCPACSKLTLPDLFLRSFRCAKPDCMGVVLGPESLGPKVRVTEYSNPKSCVSLRHEDNIGTSENRFSKEREIASLKDRDIPESYLSLEDHIGCCLGCGTVVNIEAAHEIAMSAVAHLSRLESDLFELKTEGDVKDLNGTLKGALKALNSLRMVAHPYNEQLAKGEDMVARLLCALNQPSKALNHCLKSIEILEHLYQNQHIVLGNENLKLASVALMASDIDCARQSLAIMDQIFSVHYGSEYSNRLPYVVHLQQMAKGSVNP